MAYTHEYKLEVGEYTFKGDVEITNAGIVAYTEDDDPAMPQKTKDAVKRVLDILGVLPEVYTDLKIFRLKIKDE